MGERQGCRVVDVVAARRGVPPIRGEGSRGVVDDDVGAVAQDCRLDADRGDEARVAG